MKKKIALSLVVAMFFSWICCGCDDSQKKVKFGNYKGEEISWIVLDYDDGTNLLLSEKILDVQEFDPDVLSVSRELNWRYCSLRKWLNNDFYAEAFSADEQAKIVMSMVSIEDPDLENQGGAEDSPPFFLCITIIRSSKRAYSSQIAPQLSGLPSSTSIISMHRCV